MLLRNQFNRFMALQLSTRMYQSVPLRAPATPIPTSRAGARTWSENPYATAVPLSGCDRGCPHSYCRNGAGQGSGGGRHAPEMSSALVTFNLWGKHTWIARDVQCTVYNPSTDRPRDIQIWKRRFRPIGFTFATVVHHPFL